MKERLKMKKSTLVINVSMILIGLASDVFSAEILGYPLAAKQAKFYSLILGVIVVSMVMVGIAYLGFWLADLKKRVKASRPAEKAVFAGELAAAAQSAK